MSVSLKSRQKESIGKMVNLNQTKTISNNAIEEVQWKILVYDEFSEQIVSQLLRKGDMRKNNITLYVQISSDREKIPDVPAVYFVRPTMENIRKISKDCENGLYESFYINFTNPVSRPVLEEFARLTVQSQSSSYISRIFDQYLNFVCIEENLFSFQQPNFFTDLHDNSKSNDEIETLLDELTNSIISVLVTLGTVPVIRCSRVDEISKVVAGRVEKVLRILREQRNGPLSDSVIGRIQNFQRPVLILFERSCDLTSCLKHPRTYQALCDDILGINLSKVKCDVDGKTQKYDLDTSHDQFWEKHRFDDIPTAAEMNEKSVQQWKQDSKTMQVNPEAHANAALLDSDATNRLTTAMNMVPELQERKNVIDMHTNLLTSTFEQMKNRKYNEYFELEDIISQRQLSSQERDKLIELLRNPDCGTAIDKTRLILLYCDSLDPVRVQEELRFIEKVVGDQPAINLQPVKQWVSMRNYKTASTLKSGKESSRSILAMAESVGKKVASGVKTLIGGEGNETPLTQIVNMLLENTNAGAATESEIHPYFDPKLGQSGNQPPQNRRKEPFRDAIVVAIGGCNYAEWQSLSKFAKRPNSSGQTRNIIYGGTSVVRPDIILSDLTQLYKKQNPEQPKTTH